MIDTIDTWVALVASLLSLAGCGTLGRRYSPWRKARADTIRQDLMHDLVELRDLQDAAMPKDYWHHQVAMVGWDGIARGEFAKSHVIAWPGDPDRRPLADAHLRIIDSVDVDALTFTDRNTLAQFYSFAPTYPHVSVSGISERIHYLQKRLRPNPVRRIWLMRYTCRCLWIKARSAIRWVYRLVTTGSPPPPWPPRHPM